MPTFAPVAVSQHAIEELHGTKNCMARSLHTSRWEKHLEKRQKTQGDLPLKRTPRHLRIRCCPPTPLSSSPSCFKGRSKAPCQGPQPTTSQIPVHTAMASQHYQALGRPCQTRAGMTRTWDGSIGGFAGAEPPPCQRTGWLHQDRRPKNQRGSARALPARHAPVDPPHMMARHHHWWSSTASWK
jgi:hypothetical protein